MRHQRDGRAEVIEAPDRRKRQGLGWTEPNPIAPESFWDQNEEDGYGPYIVFCVQEERVDSLRQSYMHPPYLRENVDFWGERVGVLSKRSFPDGTSEVIKFNTMKNAKP